MNTKDQVPEQAQWVYDAPNIEELARRYDQWAQDYDQEMEEVFGNVGPQRTVETFIKYVPTDAKILEVGTGTGLVGALLNQQGYYHVDGLDISLQMMEEARKKNVYTSLYQATLGEPLEFTDNTYQAIMAKGVFAPGHAPSRAFDELIRVTHRGGVIVFTLRTDYYEASDFKYKQNALEASGDWKLLEKTEPFPMWPKATQELMYNIWVYEVAKE
ncbi:class I SAM-dependent methyltransferase [Moorena sp. SIO3H5]|uniref:class I SAM-dependent DNA methyltransferase n=1 Tax=Moorena sp. SIO3H5 TaxID=2607834 RepID=UPI0013BCBD52|nr:class I SAM-dependent methyltransferase [Moorena sp. SIO3H5]NEO68849.1 methyltransferase domain-containing protein [Moorena sp. SIO3H5]